MGFSSHLRIFFTHLDTHQNQWRAAKFDLCSALIAIEQWEVFNVPHLLWHGPTLYNGHLRGPVTLTPCRAFGSGAVTTCFYDLGLSRGRIEPQSPACEAIYYVGNDWIVYINCIYYTHSLSFISNKSHLYMQFI